MSCEIFKVSPQTIEKLRELSLEKDTTIRDIIELAIHDYYDKNCSNAIKFVITDEEEFFVKAKKEHQEKIEDLVGKGPYKVTKTCRSKLGFSDGVYKLENCDFFLPVTYFDKHTKHFSALTLTVILCWILTILQGMALIYLLPLV